MENFFQKWSFSGKKSTFRLNKQVLVEKSQIKNPLGLRGFFIKGYLLVFIYIDCILFLITIVLRLN
jgi:hypothetical protein